MSNNLAQELESSLKSYSIYLEYWDIQSGDTFLMRGEREFLQEHLSDLSEAQQQRMNELDQKVLALLAVDYQLSEEDDDDDLTTLQMIGDRIQGRFVPKSNGKIIKL